METAHPPQQPQNEFDRVALDILTSYYPAVVALIGTVGAQMTFSVVLADLPDTASDVFDTGDVRKLMAASWLMFAVIIFSGFAAGLLGIFYQKELQDGWLRQRKNRIWLYLAVACNITLITTAFAAFGCMAAALSAYTNAGVGGYAAWQLGGGYLVTMLAALYYCIRHLPRRK